MAFIDRVLQEPSYGWTDKNGELVTPSVGRLYREAFRNINIFRTKKNWIPMITWLMAACMAPFFVLFITKYISLPLVGVFLLYSMIIMGTHGTIWFHRYGTHKAYTFRNGFWRFFTQNLVLRTFPEEVYIVSHHVHHGKSDIPGDPYNPKGGLFYCLLSDVNHQSIAKNLDEADYARAANFVKHTGVWVNSYKQYQKWGSISTPLYTVGLWLLNWGFWYAAFYFIGGHALACTIFSAGMFWFILVRAFNYTGHGKGQVKHVDGVDFDRRNLSINQKRPGLFAGEWHNNHHLYPRSARAGFLPSQLDPAWMYIYVMYKLGAVTSYRDDKAEFIRKYITKDNQVREIPSPKEFNDMYREEEFKEEEANLKMAQ